MVWRPGRSWRSPTTASDRGWCRLRFPVRKVVFLLDLGCWADHTPAMAPTLPPSARTLTVDEEELVEFARATIDATTDAGPDEDGVHTMGAAVRAVDGQMFAGVNLFHFTGGPCAELVALGTARAHGAVRISHIVAVGNHGRGPIGPCGRDRQVLLDYYPGVRVILPTSLGPRSVIIEELVPLATAWSIEGGSQMA